LSQHVYHACFKSQRATSQLNNFYPLSRLAIDPLECPSPLCPRKPANALDESVLSVRREDAVTAHQCCGKRTAVCDHTDLPSSAASPTTFSVRGIWNNGKTLLARLELNDIDIVASEGTVSFRQDFHQGVQDIRHQQVVSGWDWRFIFLLSISSSVEFSCPVYAVLVVYSLIYPFLCTPLK